MKKTVLVLLSLTLALMLLAGSAFAEPIKMKIANTASDKQNAHIAAVKYLKPYIEKHTNGAIVVELYPNGQLGNDRQAIESTTLGTLTGTITVAPALAVFAPTFQILDLPYLFDDLDQAYKVLAGPFGDKLNEGLDRLSIKNLMFFNSGFRNITNNKGPINTPDDMKKMKIRTMENPIHMAFFKALGANPTPVSYGELYTALQQNMVDGQENPIVNIYTIKLNEVQKYCTISRHVYASALLLVNKDWFEGLKPEYQKVIKDACAIYKTEQRKMSEAQEQEMIGEMKKAGMKFNEITPENKKKFVEAAKEVYTTFSKSVKGGAELLDLLNKSK